MVKPKDIDKDKRCRKVVAVKQDGSMGGCFDSIQTVCEKYGFTAWHIRRSCKTGSIYRGIRWMYEEDYHDLWLQGREQTLAYTLPEWQKPMQRGDRRDHTANIVSLRAYCRSLIRRFGRQMTLDEISVQLGISDYGNDKKGIKSPAAAGIVTS